jgi:methionyl-tRNA synthetase
VLPFAKEAPARGAPGELERALVDDAYPAAERAVREAFDALDPTTALNALFTLLARANEYIDRAAPWSAKKKGDSARLGTIVATLLEVLEAVSVMAAPVMPVVANEMRAQLGLAPFDWKALAGKPEALWPLALPRRPEGLAVKGGDPIFPRFEKEREAEIIAQFTPPPTDAPAPEAPKAAEATAAPKASIAYDDFAKLDLRVGVVVSAERVKKKDRLLDLRIDTGDGAPRRIVSGIAAAYTPEAMVGKRVVVLCNLAPRDFGKGIVSQGMLLTAEHEGSLSLLTPDADKPAGAHVS